MKNTPWLASLLLLSVTWGQALAIDAKVEKQIQQKLQRNQINEAQVLLKKAIKSDPKDAQARYWLAQVYWKQRDLQSTQKELDRAIELGLDDQKALPFRAQLLLVQKDYKTLLKELNVKQRAFKDPSAPWVLQLTLINADANLGLGHIEEARRLYEKTLAADPSLVVAWLGLTQSYINEKDAKKALESLEKAIEHASSKTDPSVDADIEMMRAEIYIIQNNLDNARIAYQQALDLNENHVPARIALARLNLRLQDMSSFAHQVDKLQEKAPHYPDTYYLGAIKDYHQKSFDKAIQKLEHLLKYQSKYDPARLLLANSYFKVNRFEMANKVLDQYLEKNSNNNKATVLSAAIKLKLNEPKKTIQLLEPLVRDTPHFQWLSLLGHAYVIDGQLDKGIETLEEASAQVPQDPTLKIELAASLVAKNQSDKAEELLDTFVADNDYAQADLMLIMISLKNGRPKKAENLCRELLADHETNPAFHNLLGLSLFAQQKYDKAEAIFEKALKLAPDFIAVKNNLVELNIQKKDYKSAQAWVNKILKQDSSNVKALLYNSQIAELQGKTEQALKELQTAQFRNPKNSDILLHRVSFHLRQKNPEVALQVAEEGMAQFPESIQAQHLVGQLALNQHKYEKAFAVYKHLTSEHPDHIQVLQGLARAQVGLNAIEDAQKTLETILNAQSSHLPALFLSADVALRQKDYRQVLSLAKKVVDLEPNRPVGYRLLGDGHLGLGEIEKAVSPYQKAYQLAQSSPYARAYYQVLKYSKRMSDGLEVLESHLAQHQSDTDLRRFLATEYLTQNQLEKAKTHYDKVIKESEGDFITYNNLAHIYLMLNQPETAFQHAKQAYELQPDNPSVADTFAWTLIQNNNAEKAIPILTQALLKAPKAHSLRYHRAVGFYEMGDTETAIKELEAILGANEPFADQEQAKLLLKQLKQQG